MNILKIHEVTALTRRGKASLYRDVKAGTMPQPIKLGPRSSGWVADEVHAVLSARVAGVDADGIRLLVNRLHKERQEGGIHGIQQA